MAERDSLWTMNGATRVVDAEDARVGTTALLVPSSSALRGRQGLRPSPGNPGRVTASGTPDVNVSIEKFMAALTATRGLGEYLATLDADKTMNILGTTPAHGSLQRNHIIIGRQTDTFYSDLSTKFEVVEVIGTAGAGDPTALLAAIPDYIPLARLRIPAGATTVTNAMIDDLRPSWFVALGGIIPVENATDRGTITPYYGQPIYRKDRKWIEIHDGTGWRVQNVAVCSSTSDRDTSISSAYNGQLVLTTDTGTLWLQHSGAWVAMYGASVSDTQNTAGTTTSSGGWTSTLTGGTACGVTFVAPVSGRVTILNSARISSTAGFAYCGIRVRTGAVVGSGSDVLADSVPASVQGIGASALSYSRSQLQTGLTPGASYNVQQRFIVDSGQGAFEDKHLAVTPA